MHAEAFNYLTGIRSRFHDVTGLRILEFGAHNVNGSPRALFAGCAEFVGVDPWPGPDVDCVARAQDFRSDMRFDVVISAETLEHDPDPQGLIASAWNSLKHGGKLILTAAADPRKPHRCDGYEGDLNGEYYGNIDPAQLRQWLDGWRFVEVIHDKRHGDVYAAAVKP
jgi:SAM-dependent methyltransferase